VTVSASSSSLAIARLGRFEVVRDGIMNSAAARHQVGSGLLGEDSLKAQNFSDAHSEHLI